MYIVCNLKRPYEVIFAAQIRYFNIVPLVEIYLLIYLQMDTLTKAYNHIFFYLTPVN